MADLMASLLQFPPDRRIGVKEYDKQAHDFVSQLSAIPSQHWARPVNKHNILDLLNPAVNTLPYLFALFHQNATPSKDRARQEEALTRSTLFFTSFDPVQIRYAGELWCRLLEWAFDFYLRLDLRDFTPLSTAILRVDPAAATFTSNHLLLLRVCLEAGVPSQALPILDRNIAAYPQTPHKNLPDDALCEAHHSEGLLSNSYITTKSALSLFPLKPESVLEYYLLGATIYLAFANYSRARLFLEYLLLTPAVQHSCSALQVEAYKKWLLVGLLAEGKTYPLPRTHNPQVIKTLRSLSKPYEALADDFAKRDWKKYQAEMDAGVQVWHEDGNLRLVREAGDALLRFRVLDLRKTYSALPISKVAMHLDLTPEATIPLLDDMIRAGHLSGATLTPTEHEPVLHFSPSNSPSSSTAPTPDLLPILTTRIQTLTTYLHDADRRLQLSREFIDWQKQRKRTLAAAGGGDADGGGVGDGFGGVDQMDLSGDGPIAISDGEGSGGEDIMGA